MRDSNWGGDIDIQEKTEMYDLRVRAGGKATIARVEPSSCIARG